MRFGRGHAAHVFHACAQLGRHDEALEHSQAALILLQVGFEFQTRD